MFTYILTYCCISKYDVKIYHCLISSDTDTINLILDVSENNSIDYEI